jgi:hypothetical protein
MYHRPCGRENGAVWNYINEFTEGLLFLSIIKLSNPTLNNFYSSNNKYYKSPVYNTRVVCLSHYCNSAIIWALLLLIILCFWGKVPLQHLILLSVAVQARHLPLSHLYCDTILIHQQYSITSCLQHLSQQSNTVRSLKPVFCIIWVNVSSVANR